MAQFKDKHPPSKALVGELLKGLHNTQAEEVTVRLDIVEFALGKKEARELSVHAVALSSKKPTGGNLVQSLKNAATPSTRNLATYDREQLVEALEASVKAVVRGKSTTTVSTPSPQKEAK